MASEKTFLSKLGSTRAGPRSRIWLEGKRLLDHGFAHHAFVRRQWSEGKLVLTLGTAAEYAELPREERTTVAGTAARPIIDIVGQQVRDTFGSVGTCVQVTYRAGRITITATTATKAN